MQTLSHKNAVAASRRPWMYDSNSQSAREESTATRSLMRWAFLQSPAAVAVTLFLAQLQLMRLRTTTKQTQEDTINNHLQSQIHWKHLHVFSLPTYQTEQRKVTSVRSFFGGGGGCMSEQQEWAGWMNNKREADDMAQLYLEQPSQSQRVTEAPLYRCATVEGSSSLLLGSSHPLWSLTTVSFITHGTAGVCHGWLRMWQREK